VDVNTGARDISYCSLIKFTCYRTRLPLGSAFISALPAYISRFYGERAVELWIPHDYSMDVHNYEFHFDDTGKTWTGEWTSADDRQLEADLLVDRPDASDLDYVRQDTDKVTSTELVDKNIFQRVNETGLITTDAVSVGEKTTLSGSKRTNDEVSRCDNESLDTNRTIVVRSDSDNDGDSAQDDVSMAGTAVTAPPITGTPKTTPMDTASQASDETFKGQHPHMRDVEIDEYASDDDVSKFSQQTAYTAPGANVAQAYARQNDLQDSASETTSEKSIPQEIRGTKTRGLLPDDPARDPLEDIDKTPEGPDHQDRQEDRPPVGSADTAELDGLHEGNDDQDMHDAVFVRVGSTDTEDMDQESHHTEGSKSNHSKGSTSTTSMLVKLSLRQRRRANKKRRNKQKKKDAGSPDKDSPLKYKKSPRIGTTPPRVGAKSNEA
jgi:hypothetical protein